GSDGEVVGRLGGRKDGGGGSNSDLHVIGCGRYGAGSNAITPVGPVGPIRIGANPGIGCRRQAILKVLHAGPDRRSPAGRLPFAALRVSDTKLAEPTGDGEHGSSSLSAHWR